MAWQDRIQTAAYTSPSGVRTEFDFEDVSVSFEKKTAAFEFPDADGSFIQDLGAGGRQYPFRLIFSGNDYDLVADAFMDSLAEAGTGKLEHPIYGEVNVVPFGKITRRDDLKTRGNQAVFEVAFFANTGLVYPTPQLDPGSEVLSAIDGFNAAGANILADASSLETAGERATFKGKYEKFLGEVSSGLQGIADTQADVAALFNTIESSINLGIDVLIKQPLDLAFQTSLLIQAPARALSSIQARLDAYSNLASSILNGPDPILSPDPTPSPIADPSKISNDLLVADLFASNYVAGSVVSVVNTTFITKPDAIEAAAAVLTQFEEVTTWRDANFQSLVEIDTGESYQQLQTAVALAAGLLVQISFSLKQERRIVLDRPRNALELTAELYMETVDNQLDFFISSNNLTGDEILIEIPKGREIVYYV